MAQTAWSLRPATARDHDFVVEVNRVAMGESLRAAFGWDTADLDAYFEDRIDASGGQIIEVAGVDVGELLVEERPSELFVVRLALLPAWQGRGIGSAILRMLAERARERGAVLTLEVFEANARAVRLYESLGFVRNEGTRTEASMRLDPSL